MANQSKSMVSIAATQDDLSNWELINYYDFEFDGVIVVNDDDESIYDLIESIDSLSSTSASDIEQELLHHDQENQQPTIDHHDVVVDDDLSCSRASDLGKNQANRDRNDGFVEYCNGSSLISHVQDESDDDVDVNCFRVFDLGENQWYLDGSLDKNDGFVENISGSSLILHGHDDGHVNHDDDGVHDDDDDDDDDGYGMDDELVPWEVKDRLMRQRIRKSGKKSIGGLAKSKKSALVFTRPGCVRGKHGLGLKF